MRNRILVATDGRAGALGALRMARWLAERDGSSVEVLAVYEPTELYTVGYPDIPGSVTAQLAPARIEALRARVQAQLDELGGGAAAWPLSVRTGRVAPLIARFAVETQARLILLGLRQPGALERWLGREALLRLVHLAQVPVLSVPSGMEDLPRQAIVAVDFSEFSLRAAREALRWLAPAARLHLVYVAPGPSQGEAAIEAMPSLKALMEEADRRMRALAEELEQASEVPTRVHVLTGEPAREILRVAEEIGADLLVAGSHGAGFFGRLVMGSVSSRLVHGAQCAILLVPPAEPPAELLELTERELLAGLGTAGELALSRPAPAETPAA